MLNVTGDRKNNKIKLKRQSHPSDFLRHLLSKEHRGTIPTIIPSDEQHHSVRISYFIYLRNYTGVGASRAAEWRGQTAPPTRHRRRRRRRDWGLAPQLHRSRRRSDRAPVSSLAVRCDGSTGFSTPRRCPAPCAARNPVPPARRPARFPPSDATRGSTNRPNTTAAAGALKCRPSSFMRRASTQPTDGCCGRPKVRTSRKSRGKFARVRRRGRKRKKEKSSRRPKARVARIHEDPRRERRV